ncbi:MAG: hypothetical protein R2813_07990 [Flavobacteriales bacterium]
MLSTKGLEYDAKILLAWGECISGNDKITQWLMKNGFPELGLFRYALRNEERSREWLMTNGFPHLHAMISAIEGRKDALEWLERHGFELIKEMALIGDGDEGAMLRLNREETKVFAGIAKKMQFVKDEIEDENNDWHKYSAN